MRIAVLGTGIMGAAMARNLAREGHEVRAWNRSPAKAEPLAGDGIAVAAAPEEAAQDAEVLLTMLLDADATTDPARAALGALAPGAVWWQAGTVGVPGAQRLADLAAAAGVAYVDGPVLGTRAPAEAGQLTVVAAGPDDALDRLAPVFGATAAKVVRTGPPPSASRFKLVLNHWVAGLTTLTGETVRLARALDVDPARFLETIAGGPLDAGYAQLKGRSMLEGTYPTSFSVSNVAKDVRLMLEAAEEADLDLALAPAMLARFEAAERAGHGASDMAAVVEG
jgi:3-hydroxyisobutyrate dehydrogenase